MSEKYALLERFNQEQSDLEVRQITELFGRLYELFPSIKEMQPKINYMYCGMGIFGFDGQTKKQYWDMYSKNNTDKIIRKVPKELVKDHYYKDIRIYECYEHGQDLTDYIEDFQKGTNCEIEATLDYFINDEMIEFYDLCVYMTNNNWTTFFDGVNENGIIICFGKGSKHDTYLEATDSTPFEALKNAGIPIVLHDTTLNVYYNLSGEVEEL